MNTSLPRKPSRQSSAWGACLLALTLGVGVPAQSAVQSTEGAAVGDQLGRSIVTIPDIDGDQRPDWAAGSPFRTATAGALTGVVELRSGATGALITTIEGDQAGHRFGTALGLADVTGDGSPELLVGAPLHTGTAGSFAGRVTAHSIPSGTVVLTVEGLAAGDRFGSSIAGLADLDSDGRTEFAVGAPLFDGTAGSNTGRVSVHDGAGGGEVGALEGEAAQDRFGTSVANAGDVDLDFEVELVVGAPFHDGLLGADQGRVYLLSAYAALVTTADGLGPGERFGSVVAGAGDVDADGTDDVVVSADVATTAAGTFAGRVDALDGATLTNLWSADGTEAGARFGAALSGGTDMNGDLLPEIVVGSPLYDGLTGFDTGRIAVLSPLDGSEQWSVEGPADFAQLGFALDARSDLDFDGRPDVLTSAPFFDGVAGVQTGRVDVVREDPQQGREVDAYPVGLDPEQAVAIDADGDGDLDIAVVCSGDNTLHVLWNGDHATSGPTFGSGQFDTIAPAIVSLMPGADALRLTAGQMDTDPVVELAVGRSDGTVQIIDGSGTTAVPSFGPMPGLVVVDTRAAAGPIGGLTVVNAGPSATIMVGLSGNPVLPGQLRPITDPLGAANVGASVLSGGSFTTVEAVDIDGDFFEDIVATNTSSPVNGGVHILLGPTWTQAPNSPFVVSAIPVSATVAALDGDGMNNDVLVAELGFVGGGAGVLSDFVPASGFSSAIPAIGPLAARDIAPWNPSISERGAALVDGLGNLFLLDGWTGAAFSSSTPFPVGPIVDVASAQLTAWDGATACNGDELVCVSRSDGAVRVVRQAVSHVAMPIAGTGCPGGPVMSFIGSPVIGDLTFTVRLTGGAPNTFTELALEPAPPGGTPSLFPFGPCAFATYSFNWLFFPFTTNASGEVNWFVPLPNDPSLLCLEFLGTWAVHDGGPVFGRNLSQTWTVRIGEF